MKYKAGDTIILTRTIGNAVQGDIYKIIREEKTPYSKAYAIEEIKVKYKGGPYILSDDVDKYSELYNEQIQLELF